MCRNVRQHGHEFPEDPAPPQRGLDRRVTRAEHRSVAVRLCRVLVAVAAAHVGGCASGGATHTVPPPSAAPASRALDPAASPGGNFDLSLWELQEPVGAPGKPTIVKPAALVGRSGYHDSFFFTDPADGAMTFWDPESGVATPNSRYPRSELREMNADGSPANWPVAGTNRLTATLAVTEVPDHVCVGQIHVGTPIQAGLVPSTKPLLELYVYASGRIALGIENDPTGGQTSYDVGQVPLGARFTYAIQLTGDGTISVTLDGATKTFKMAPTFGGYGHYFKAGDYDQTVGRDASVGAKVKFYALSVSH